MGENNTPDRRATEVRLTDETIAYLEERIGAAVSTGIKNAMTEDTAAAFWAAGLSVLQRQAIDHAGRFVLGGAVGRALEILDAPIEAHERPQQ